MRVIHVVACGRTRRALSQSSERMEKNSIKELGGRSNQNECREVRRGLAGTSSCCWPWLQVMDRLVVPILVDSLGEGIQNDPGVEL